MAKNEIISIDWTPVIKAQEQCTRKIVQRTAKGILKKAGLDEKAPKRRFSFKSVNDTKELYQLAAYLFAFEEYDLCFDVCRIYDQVEFAGDYTLWSFIEKIRNMQIAILNRKGESAKAQEILAVLKQQELPLENQKVSWKTICEKAGEYERQYEEAREGKRTPSVVRYLILGTAMICLQYIQMGYLPEEHETMKEWMEKIFVFLRAEEKQMVPLRRLE